MAILLRLQQHVSAVEINWSTCEHFAFKWTEIMRNLSHLDHSSNKLAVTGATARPPEPQLPQYLCNTKGNFNKR